MAQIQCKPLSSLLCSEGISAGRGKVGNGNGNETAQAAYSVLKGYLLVAARSVRRPPKKPMAPNMHRMVYVAIPNDPALTVGM
jgi:hypothetical protein